MGVCHRDLKPENLIICENSKLKITDFGFSAPSKGKDGSGCLYTKLGTKPFIAPEVWNK